MKIKISCGGFKVKYEGDEQFAKESLCSLISEIKKTIQTEEEASRWRETYESKPDGVMKLPSFLAKMENRSERNSLEYRKFLVAAAWLHLNKRNTLQTSDVASALRDSKINKLSNPSDCLTKNIKNGHCERLDGNKFIVTQKGFQDLNLQMPD